MRRRPPSPRLISVNAPFPTYQDGDVIIYTGNEPDSIFLVHKDVLVTGSQYFRSALGEEWGRYACSLAGTDSPRVYQMDLEFDMDTSMALPVLRRTFGADDAHASEKQHDRPPATLEECKRQFLWSQPRDTIRDSRRKKLAKRIYERFGQFPVFEKDPDELNAESLWSRVKNHRQALEWVRCIWECLIHLMYGHTLSLTGDSHSWSQPHVVVALQAYADVLNMSDTIMRQVPRILMTLPKVYERVFHNPSQWFQLAYNLRLPDLYMDSLTHLVAWTGAAYREVNFDCLKDSSCDDEQYAIVLAGWAVREDQRNKLRDRIQKWLDKERMWTGNDRSPDAIACAAGLRRIFAQELYPALARLDGNCCSFQQWSSSGVLALRWLRDIACGRKPLSLLEKPIDQSPLANESCQVPELRKRVLTNALSHYAQITACLDLSFNASKTRYAPGICEHGARRCDLCPRARYQHPSDDGFRFLNHRLLFPFRSVRPWPLNGELEEEEAGIGVESTRFREVDEASSEYLRSVGLGESLNDPLQLGTAIAMINLREQCKGRIEAKRHARFRVVKRTARRNGFHGHGLALR